MRCSFCFADNKNTGETCAVCGSPLRGLPPQKAVVAQQSSTRSDEMAASLPAPRAILPKPAKRKTTIQEQSPARELQLIAHHKLEEPLLCASFWTQSRQDDAIVFVTRRGELQLWNPQSDTVQIVSAPRAKTVSAPLITSFDAANGHIVLAWEDGRTELLDVTRGARSTRLSGEGAKATSLALAGKAQVLAVAGEDGTIRLWDLSSPKPTPQTTMDLCGLHRVAIAPDAAWLACGDDSGQVQVWNMKAQPLAQSQWNFDAHRLWVSSLAFSPNAQMLASGGYDGTVLLYASQNGFEMARFPSQDQDAEFGAVSSLCFAGNRLVAIAYAQGTVALLDSWTGTTTPLTHLSSAVTYLATSSDGDLLLALCRNEALLWRLPFLSLS
ncbi:MAG TPA: hypothetical protein VM821_04905 [Abditibacteriaceae bacterium]|nr:hypothetical protein [Abditibacteriaceae bacterium]